MESSFLIQALKPAKPPKSTRHGTVLSTYLKSRYRSHRTLNIVRKHSLNAERPLSQNSTRSSSIESRSSSAKRRVQSPSVLPHVSATSWCVYDATHESIMQGRKEHEVREIASLTKIMTCYATLRLIDKLDEVTLDSVVTVTAKAASMAGTSANLLEGDNITVWDLLHGLMLPSGNDAAWALAEYFGGVLEGSTQVKPFLSQMNGLAQELSMMNTYYQNPHGLAVQRNLSTARDVCKLAKAAMADSRFARIVNTKMHTCSISGPNARKKQWENTNKLLDRGFEGVKTGITNTAGPCLCSSDSRRGIRVIVVVLNAKSLNHRWIEVPKLTDWAFSRLSN